MNIAIKSLVVASFALSFVACTNKGVAGEALSSETQSARSSTSGGTYDGGDLPTPASGTILIDHNATKLADIPASAITNAIEDLVIAYGHTSHGSQLSDGLNGLDEWKGAPYLFGGEGGLEMREGVFNGANDLGAPDFTAWVGATRTYLTENDEVNVIMWSWCGQVGGASEEAIQGYLDSMSTLEEEFPEVQFVYMTGHLDGSGVEGTLHQNNQRIRAYVREHGKILYDFADIESYDPDGKEFLSLNANDNCDYDGGNWCTEWQEANPGEWYEVSAAHSQSLNGNRKAYAAWYLFARLAGWSGK